MAFYTKSQREWTKRKGFRCPYMALMIAVEEGKGLHLSADEVHYLSTDSAIATVASNRHDEITGDGDAILRERPE